MSKLISKFPNEVPGRGQAHISISLGGVEIDWDCPGTMTLDPVQARTLATLLMHASNEAEMMQMRKKLDDERPEPSPIRKPGFGRT